MALETQEEHKHQHQQDWVKVDENERYATLSKINRDENHFLLPNTVHLCLFGIEDVSSFQQSSICYVINASKYHSRRNSIL